MRRRQFPHFPSIKTLKKQLACIGQTGFEPVASTLAGECSIQLNYWPPTKHKPQARNRIAVDGGYGSVAKLSPYHHHWG
jgi:hypothetical protein